MTAKAKTARRRLSLPEPLGETNDVSKTCRIMGHLRRQFLEIRRDRQTCGAENLR